VCKEARLVIEVDGGQHSEHVDRCRAQQLTNRGYRVLRFWNNEVDSNMDGVLVTIIDALDPRQ